MVMIKNSFLFLLILVFCINNAYSIEPNFGSQMNVKETGSKAYKNPIIHADYSDPDAIRVGDDYYMVSSSFGHFPGLPVLHSKDLVNWKVISYAAQVYPFPEFSKPQHGFAIWAPSIRFHNGEFYIYFGDPDRGVFMTKTKDPAGCWEPLKHIKKVTGWIDCCPFWDEDGSAYLVHAFANSRCGIKSVLSISRMNDDGTEVLGTGTLVFNGQNDHPTIEGPKMYKRNGYYYIFAPAGGVKTGWQTILRSESIFGPYEDKIVLEQGSTNVNGPHQGAWVTTPAGEDWFIHFQDRHAYGRIVHLQPMRWEEDWPVMGIDYDKNGIGEPVNEYTMPNVGADHPFQEPQTSDEFEGKSIGLQWQWQSNFCTDWYSLTDKPGSLTLFSAKYSSEDINLWDVGRIMLQKMPAAKFSATTSMELHAKDIGEKAGLLVFGRDYSYIAIEKGEDNYTLSQMVCKNADNQVTEKTIEQIELPINQVFLRVDVSPENLDEIVPKVMCKFSYSLDGKNYKNFGEAFEAVAGQWVGAKVGLFSIAPEDAPTTGSALFDWFRIKK